MIEYNEKIYRKIGAAGKAGIALGIILIIVGIAIGTVSIIFGANALHANRHLVD